MTKPESATPEPQTENGLPIRSERRTIQVLWAVLAVLSVLTCLGFTVLAGLGEVPWSAAGWCVASTVVWIGVGVRINFMQDLLKMTDPLEHLS